MTAADPRVRASMLPKGFSVSGNRIVCDCGASWGHNAPEGWPQRARHSEFWLGVFRSHRRMHHNKEARR